MGGVLNEITCEALDIRPARTELSTMAIVINADGTEGRGHGGADKALDWEAEDVGSKSTVKYCIAVCIRRYHSSSGSPTSLIRERWKKSSRCSSKAVM